MSISCHVWIAEDVVRGILREAASKRPLETGGILLGYLGEENRPVVTSMSGPGEKAVHSEDFYEPDYEYHEAAALEWWEATDRTEFYLGDWHSHPQSAQSLSWRDRRALRFIGRSRDAELERPLMAVIGGSKVWKLTVWRYGSRIHSWIPFIRPEGCKPITFRGTSERA